MMATIGGGWLKRNPRFSGRPQRWSIFQGDGMVNVFFQATIAVNGFDKVGPSPLNVFWGVQPLEPMVF